jgi:hypothetical protein
VGATHSLNSLRRPVRAPSVAGTVGFRFFARPIEDPNIDRNTTAKEGTDVSHFPLGTPRGVVKQDFNALGGTHRLNQTLQEPKLRRVTIFSKNRLVPRGDHIK